MWRLLEFRRLLLVTLDNNLCSLRFGRIRLMVVLVIFHTAICLVVQLFRMNLIRVVLKYANLMFQQNAKNAMLMYNIVHLESFIFIDVSNWKSHLIWFSFGGHIQWHSRRVLWSPLFYFSNSLQLANQRFPHTLALLKWVKELLLHDLYSANFEDRVGGAECSLCADYRTHNGQMLV